MLAIQASTFGTSKHAFSADGGRTMTSTHYLARAGKDNFMSVLVEPGTGNIYVVGDRYTQPNQDTNTPGGAANFHTSQRAVIIKFDKLGNILWLRELSKDGVGDVERHSSDSGEAGRPLAQHAHHGRHAAGEKTA